MDECGWRAGVAARVKHGTGRFAWLRRGSGHGGARPHLGRRRCACPRRHIPYRIYSFCGFRNAVPYSAARRCIKFGRTSAAPSSGLSIGEYGLIFYMRIKIAFFMLSLVAAMSAAAQAYEVKGNVVSVRQVKGDAKCYVAIKDLTNRYYSEGYHLVDDRQICAMANAAFVTGAIVRGRGQVGPKGGVNEFDAIDLSRTGASPYWPPYGRHAKSGE